ncbi:MAG: CvpA family protein [Planctomycetia bacterium]|nr:CvpA family protein [Planctomycetia bacterium]
MALCDYFDSFVLCILLLGTLFGLFSGFISTLSILLATGTGFFVSRSVSFRLQDALGMDHPLGRLIVSFFVFAIVSLCVYKIMNMLSNLIRAHKLRAWDAILGMVLGFVLSLAVSWGVAWFITFFEGARPLVSYSRSAKYLVCLAEFGKNRSADGTNVCGAFIARVEASEDGGETPSSVGDGQVGMLSATALTPHWTLREGEEPSVAHRFLDVLDGILSSCLPVS